MEIFFDKTRFNLPKEHNRIIYITYSGRFCIGWFIEGAFMEYGTSIRYTPDRVLFWIYEDELMPKEFNEEQKNYGLD